MWATAELIGSAGCENVHLDCAATDVAYVMSKYDDRGTDLTAAKECLQSKCGGSFVQEQGTVSTTQAPTLKVDDKSYLQRPDVDGMRERD